MTSNIISVRERVRALQGPNNENDIEDDGIIIIMNLYKMSEAKAISTAQKIKKGKKVKVKDKKVSMKNKKDKVIMTITTKMVLLKTGNNGKRITT